ncbi:MAG TPA: phytanoyl-CoA dioxygenase family protein [Polyangiaceae bacterium]
MSSGRAAGDRYSLTVAERSAFESAGWIRLPNFVDEAELAALERDYMALLRREIPVTGRDYCDMAGDYARPIEDFEILNVMLPRRYHPALAGNVYERRAADVARQLCGDDMVLDYDQFVAKPPHKPGAVFHWHQDLGYWPITDDTRTASFWLALDDTRLDNGCLRFVRGSHREPELRAHLPLHDDRSKSHTLVATVDESRELVDTAELRRGDVTVHHERAVHGSGGNGSARWRRGYVVAFRSHATVARERELGFTHSHNDDVQVLNWIARQSASSPRRGA